MSFALSRVCNTSRFALRPAVASPSRHVSSIAEQQLIFPILRKEAELPTKERIIKIVSKLKPEPGIQFKQESVAENYESLVVDGTCSATTLKFLDLYFKTRKEQPADFIKALSKLQEPCYLPKTARVAEQAAFNTIVVTDRTGDCSRKKVQSLLNTYNFRTTDTSPMFDLCRLASHPPEQVIPRLNKDGVYFIRITIPDASDKLELYGHSMACIKEKGMELLFDPPKGLYDLSGDRTALDSHLREVHGKWHVRIGRFYAIDRL